jgi:cytochrome c2
MECNSADILRGKDLFINQCSSCHSIYSENYGPALGSVAKRKPKLWLFSFIRNSQQVIKSGDPYSTHLFEQFDKKVMVSMEFLSEDEIMDILKYIEFSSAYSPVTGNTLEKNISTSHANANDYLESTSGGPFFIVFFIGIISIAAVIQFLLIAKLYLYLKE